MKNKGHVGVKTEEGGHANAYGQIRIYPIILCVGMLCLLRKITEGLVAE